MGDGEYRIVFTPLLDRIIRRLRKKDPDLARAIALRFPKLEQAPELGKPLKHALRNFRRMHIEGSFVLLYEIQNQNVVLVDFDHHDRIYKKYS